LVPFLEREINSSFDRVGALREEEPRFRAMHANFYGVYAEADRVLHLRTIERIALVRHDAPAVPPDAAPESWRPWGCRSSC